jgi:hypothetical protein
MNKIFNSRENLFRFLNYFSEWKRISRQNSLRTGYSKLLAMAEECVVTGRDGNQTHSAGLEDLFLFT